MTDSDDGEVGIWMTTALVIGTIIGAGIFMLPVAWHPWGPTSLVGWMVSGVGRLRSRFACPVLAFGGEGIQANIEQEFGPTVGFLVAWSFWVSNWAAQASVAVAAGSTIALYSSDLNSTRRVIPLAICCVVVLTVNSPWRTDLGWSFDGDRRYQDSCRCSP